MKKDDICVCPGKRLKKSKKDESRVLPERPSQANFHQLRKGSVEWCLNRALYMIRIFLGV